MFGGLGGLGDIAKLMSMAKDLQGNIKNIQEEIGKMEFTGNSGNGAIQVVVSGKMEIKKMFIKQEAISLKDAEMLQDMIVAATNSALAEAKNALKSKIEEKTGGLNLPNIF